MIHIECLSHKKQTKYLQVFSGAFKISNAEEFLLWNSKPRDSHFGKLEQGIHKSYLENIYVG